jgi:hypothetical protein
MDTQLTQLVDACIQQLFANGAHNPHLDLTLWDIERRLQSVT